MERMSFRGLVGCDVARSTSTFSGIDEGPEAFVPLVDRVSQYEPTDKVRVESGGALGIVYLRWGYTIVIFQVLPS